MLSSVDVSDFDESCWVLVDVRLRMLCASVFRDLESREGPPVDTRSHMADAGCPRLFVRHRKPEARGLVPAASLLLCT